MNKDNSLEHKKIKNIALSIISAIGFLFLTSTTVSAVAASMPFMACVSLAASLLSLAIFINALASTTFLNSKQVNVKRRQPRQIYFLKNRSPVTGKRRYIYTREGRVAHRF